MILTSILQRLWRFLLITAAVLLIVVGLAFGLARVALPFASDYRAELETYIGETLNTPVRIGTMDVEWRGWGPLIRLRDVSLVSGRGDADLLRLEEIFIGLQLGRALFAKDLQIANIYLEGVQIVLQRDAEGAISVRGLRAQGEQASNAPEAENTANILGFLLLAGRIDLFNASVILSDIGSGIEYYFPQATIHAQNEADRHQLFAQVELPSELGGHIGLYIDFTGDLSNPKEIVGTSFVNGRSLNVYEFMKHVPQGVGRADTGHVDFAFWSNWSGGRLASATFEMRANDLVLAGNADESERQVRSWSADKVALNGQWQREENGWDLTVNQVDVMRDGEQWASNAARLRASTDADEAMSLVGNGRFLPVADSIELVLAVLGESRAQALASYVDNANPRGNIDDWRLQVDDVETGAVRLAGHFSELASDASNDLPGLTGLRGEFRSEGNRMEFDIDSRDVVFSAPTLFRDPLELDVVQGQLGVNIGEDAVRLESAELRVENADIKTRSRLHAVVFPDGDAQFDMQTNFHSANAARVPHYLPTGIMDWELIEWFDQAGMQGSVPVGSVLWRGNFNDFPYRGHEGVFEVDSTFNSAGLQFDSEWPRVLNAEGSLNIRGAKMAIQSPRAEFHSSPVGETNITIGDLEYPILDLTGSLKSYVPELIHFARNGPMADILA
ncbi:MAG: DUF3971 domain-containing protein, partial [Pseudomonadota bacterium]